VSRYQKGKTRKVKPISIYWSKRQSVAVASAGPYATLTPFDLLQLARSPRAGNTWVHLIPHSTHPQSSSLHGTVKAGSRFEIEKRALPPHCFPSFNFQSTLSQELRSHSCHQCLRGPECTSSQVRCIPPHPDRLVTHSIATLLLSQGEPMV